MKKATWNYFTFKVSYLSRSRKVSVFSPNETIARLSVASFEDEKIELLKEVSGSFVFARKSKLKPKELINLLKNLYKCMRSGASISKSLQISLLDVNDPLTRGLIGVLIHHTLKNGLLLSEAMSRVDTFFDPITIAIIKAGEQSGELVNVLEDYTKKLEQFQQLKSKTLSGLYYPLIVICITLVAAGIVNFFVFPSIIRNFKMLNAELPRLTKWMANIVELTTDYPVLLLIPFLLFCSLIFFRKRIYQWALIQRLVLRIPIFGQLIGGTILTRSLYVLSLLQKSGVNVVDAYNMTIAVAGNISFKEYFASVLTHIKVGDTPDRAFLKERYRLGKQSIEIANLMRITAFTGDDWVALRGLAESLETNIKVKSEALPKLIEPILLLFIASIVGLMIAAIYLPSFYLLLNAFKN